LRCFFKGWLSANSSASHRRTGSPKDVRLRRDFSHEAGAGIKSSREAAPTCSRPQHPLPEEDTFPLPVTSKQAHPTQKGFEEHASLVRREDNMEALELSWWARVDLPPWCPPHAWHPGAEVWGDSPKLVAFLRLWELRACLCAVTPGCFAWTVCQRCWDSL